VLRLRGDGIDIVLLDREIFGVFAVGLGPIGDIGNVLFLRLVLVECGRGVFRRSFVSW
jgi:hypothetical protein